jgi:NitT/TauT family transport system substrate-binding protein
LAALAEMQRKGQKSNVAYVFDDGSGLKLFADQAFYAIGPGKGDTVAIAPFMLKKDAEAKAQAIGGKAGTFADALAAVSAGG